MMGLATPQGLKSWAKAMKPPGRPGRPPKFGSQAWARRHQLPLALTSNLPDPRNAGFASASRPGLFSTAVQATFGTAESGLNGAFFALNPAPHFSCARVVAPHISAMGCTNPLFNTPETEAR